MQVNYLPSFVRDLKALKKSPIYSKLKKLAFQDIPSYEAIDQIANLKKLRGEDNAYRIRVGDYRMGLFIEAETITFARVKHRREIYRSFP
ncbi:MAG: type II toxin-antitoxin system RelE/ParE family toxin [Cyanobacteria bacterium P01_F01_bin.56]